ncbi:MAG: adenylate/guanylate cyclase domain-containing protein [Bacteroidia bacterium]
MIRWFKYVFLFTGWIAGPIAFANEKDTTHVDQLVKQAIEAEMNGDFQEVLRLARIAYDEATGMSYARGTGSSCMRLGSAYQNMGKSDSALYFYRQAYQIRKSLKQLQSLCSTCISMSYVYTGTAKYDSAFALLFEALTLNQSTGNEVGIASVYIELGNLSIEYKDLDKARDYLLLADQTAAVSDDKDIKVSSAGALGNYYFTIRQHAKALTYFFRVDSLLQSEQPAVNHASNLNNIGLCYSELEQYDRASHYFHRGLSAYRELGMRYDEGNTCFNLGTMYNNRKMPDSAIVYLKQALQIAVEIGDLRHQCLGYEYMADAYVLKHDYQQAYEYHVLSAQLNDSLMNAEKISSISEMQTKYETGLKEEQILRLHEQSTFQVKQRNGLMLASLLLLGFSAFVFWQRQRIKLAKLESDKLLLNILPAEIADELKRTGGAIAKQYNHVTVLFTDFVNFTGISEQMTPTELVKEIDRNFKAFDAIIERHGLEKIKTIGDAYLAVCGLPKENEHHALQVAKAAMDIRQYMLQSRGKFQVRIGLHSGPVVAGIVGVKKYAYDIWGDTVNTAARMEQHSEPGKINISGATYELIHNEVKCMHRGKIAAKNKGEVNMYFVEELQDI